MRTHNLAEREPITSTLTVGRDLGNGGSHSGSRWFHGKDGATQQPGAPAGPVVAVCRSAALIIPLIIQTIRLEPTRSTQSTRLRIWRSGHGGCWPLPYLAVAFLVGHRGGGWTVVLPAVQRGVAAGSARRCRRRGCPQPPGTYRLPVSTGRVHCPSVRTVAVRRLRRPGAELQARVRGTAHRGSVPGASGRAAGCWPDGRCPPRRRPQL